MRKSFRFILALSAAPAVLMTAATLPAVTLGAGAAFAQQGGEAPQEVALTPKMIDSLIASQPEMSALQAKAQGNQDKPDPALQAKMEAVAKKHGFAGLGDYEGAAETVGAVLSGIDPETKSYVGTAAIIKKQMAQVQADKTLPAKDKAQTLQEMKEAIANAGSNKPSQANIDIVSKNYAKLSEGFQGGE